MEKTPDGDISISTTESCDCKNGHILDLMIDDSTKVNTAKKLPPLAVKTGLLEKIEAKCVSLPCKLKVVHILVVVVAAVWALLSLPIIFYHLPVEEVHIVAYTIIRTQH